MNNLLKSGYIDHPFQLCTVRRMTVAEGKGKGMDIIEVTTAGGLQVDLMPDTGLDIGQVRYKGVNVTFICKNGYDSPAAISSHGDEFLNTFPGGLLYTCGLRTTGGNHDDNGDYQPMHGRYHGLPAEPVAVYEEDGCVIVKGTVRETALFGYDLELKRTIKIPAMGSEITVSDELTNLAFKDEEYAILYHCNFGYPLLSEKAYLELPEKRKTTPRTEFAATGLHKVTKFDAPTPCEEERVFFHEDMEHKAAIVNKDVGIKAELTWSDNLPILAHWRSMASGDYVCGLEPTNCYIMGRKAERENGTLPVIKSFETIKTEIKFSFTNT